MNPPESYCISLGVQFDVVHRLEVELKPLELDDERLRNLAEADPLLSVHLRALWLGLGLGVGLGPTFAPRGGRGPYDS